MLDNTSGVCLSSLKCKSHPLIVNRSMLFGGNTQGGKGTPTHGIYNMFVLLERAFFAVGYQFSPVNVTYNCICSVIYTSYNDP